MLFIILDAFSISHVSNVNKYVNLTSVFRRLPRGIGVPESVKLHSKAVSFNNFLGGGGGHKLICTPLSIYLFFFLNTTIGESVLATYPIH